MLRPNKEIGLASLTLGFNDFGKQQSRARREKAYKREVMDKDVKSPDIYTHHDNATKALTDMRAVAGGTKLSPNLRFDNSPGRDHEMYHLSDLTNLNQERDQRRTNELDEYLDIENILPH